MAFLQTKLTPWVIINELTEFTSMILHINVNIIKIKKIVGVGEVNYLTPQQRLTVACALKTIPAKIWLCTLSLIAGWYRLQEQTLFSATQQLYIQDIYNITEKKSIM